MEILRVKKAVIPAAGLGTRFLPATKAQPKEMLPLLDTPIIQYVIQEAIDAGIEDILIITGRGKRAIEDHFDRSIELETLLQKAHKLDLLETVRSVSNLADIHFIRQKEPLGLGHAIACAQQHVGNEPFAVLLGDEIFASSPPCIKQLIEESERLNGGQASVIGCMEVSREEIGRYGAIKGERLGPQLYRIEDMVEKPRPEAAPSCLAIIGRYVLHPAIFDLLQEVKPGAGGEIQLTDALRELAKKHTVYSLRPHGIRYDVGELPGYLEATVSLALERPDLAPQFREFLLNKLAAAENPPRQATTKARL